ncbi:MAG: hypothetical protein MI863_26615 [Desulfobacterales bacterium]|nr:hypothetical protein [Desulfobacterales bacterium]
MDKEGGFIGKEACEKKLAQGPLKRRLAQVLVKDAAPLLFHAEVITRDGKNAGYVRSGSYCWTLGGAVGLFMIETGDGQAVDQAYIDAGNWEIGIAGKTYPAEVSLAPMYDPKNEKIKC